MDKIDIAIIGAGVVGLAIAERLAAKPGQSVVVFERNDSFGRETSSRNSEVIHAGFYYQPGSLKTTLCVEGNRLMYEYCRTYDVPHRAVGKMVVASSREEEEKILGLYERGKMNSVPGLSLIDKKRITALEPDLAGSMGMLSDSTGILDSHQLMLRLEQSALSRGTIFAYNCNVTALARTPSGYSITALDADRKDVTVCADVVINAAGLGSDVIAALAGVAIDEAGYRIRYCKGEYFRINNRHRHRLKRLVYPAPTPISLGIHVVLGLDGSLRLGPSAFFVDTIDYHVDSLHKVEFYNSAKKLFSFLELDDLTPDQAGIRPKLAATVGSFADFIIREESLRGLPGFINLIGMESPALTSALAIAKYVEQML